MRENRSIQLRELRAEKRDGKDYLVGHAAVFGVMADIGKKFRERVMPGAFARAIREKQDVRHLQNHDPSRVLGRTGSGTTVLAEDATGLRFETCLPDTSYARDLAALVVRGDVNEGSFGFECRTDRWVKEDGVEVRELVDLDLFDISTVTFPAYPGTDAEISLRAMFPDGMPAELRTRLAGAGGSGAGGQGSGAGDRGSEAGGQGPGAGDRRLKESRQRVGALLVPVTAKAPEFRTQREDGVCELGVYGDIGEDWWSMTGGITAKWVRAQLDAAGAYSRVRVCINSLGGDAFEAITIYNVLRAQGRPVDVRIDGLAASAASIVAMAGDTIAMGSNCLMMIHNASDGCFGTAEDHERMATALETISGALAQTYVDRTTLPMAEVQALMDAETWMGASDCLAKGFCTEVLAAAAPVPTDPGEEGEDPEEGMMAVARSSRALRMYRNVPAGLLARVKDPPVVADIGLEGRRMRLRVAMAQ